MTCHCNSPRFSPKGTLKDGKKFHQEWPILNFELNFFPHFNPCDPKFPTSWDMNQGQILKKSLHISCISQCWLHIQSFIDLFFLNVPVIAFFGIWTFDSTPGGGTKTYNALAHSCHVVIITNKFGEFLYNCERDGETEPITISPQFFFQKGWG